MTQCDSMINLGQDVWVRCELETSHYVHQSTEACAGATHTDTGREPGKDQIVLLAWRDREEMH